ncbi:MAG: 5-oxoprolinase subunit PxpB [Crocinitomicaceae bacterium]
MLKPKISQFGEKGLLLTWDNRIDDAIHTAVLAYQNWIEKEHGDLIQETNIGYQSLLVLIKNEIDLPPLISMIEDISVAHLTRTENSNYLYTVPVCYDISFGLDLATLAQEKNLTIQEIIALHTSQIYKVYFTGFLPGFLYLGGLNPKLHASRLSKPRLEIPKGSVGIGGEQTGIYPQNSPGGWRIIGKTPLLLFNKDNKQPTLCQPGDEIQFESISLQAFKTIEAAILKGTYKIRKEALND